MASATPKTPKAAKTPAPKPAKAVNAPKTAKTPKADAAAAPPKPTVDFRRAADVLKQVSDPTRLQIVQLLLQEPMNVTGICAALGAQTQPAVSHHIALLKAARLIEGGRDGKFNIYRLTNAGQELANHLAPLVASIKD